MAARRHTDHDLHRDFFLPWNDISLVTGLNLGRLEYIYIYILDGCSRGPMEIDRGCSRTMRCSRFGGARRNFVIRRENGGIVFIVPVFSDGKIEIFDGYFIRHREHRWIIRRGSKLSFSLFLFFFPLVAFVDLIGEIYSRRDEAGDRLIV